MTPKDLYRLAARYSSLPDAELRDAFSAGPAGYTDGNVWDIIVRECIRRGLVDEQETAGHEVDAVETPVSQPDSPAVLWDGARQEFVRAPDGIQALQSDKDPRGLGGWLIVVAIGLAIGVIGGVIQIDTTLELLVGGLKALATGDAVYPIPAALLALHAFAVLGLIVAGAVALALYFRRSPAFPRLMIALYVANFVVVLLALLASILLPMAPDENRISTFELLYAFVGGAVWISYMSFSKRVRNTFVARDAEIMGADSPSRP